MYLPTKREGWQNDSMNESFHWIFLLTGFGWVHLEGLFCSSLFQTCDASVWHWSPITVKYWVSVEISGNWMTQIPHICISIDLSQHENETLDHCHRCDIWQWQTSSCPIKKKKKIGWCVWFVMNSTDPGSIQNDRYEILHHVLVFCSISPVFQPWKCTGDYFCLQDVRGGRQRFASEQKEVSLCECVQCVCLASRRRCSPVLSALFQLNWVDLLTGSCLMWGTEAACWNTDRFCVCDDMSFFYYKSCPHTQ